MLEDRREVDKRTLRKFNAFLKHSKDKCIIFAYIPPIVPLLDCIVEHKLASGIGYYQGFDGNKLGHWPSTGEKKPRIKRGPHGEPILRSPARDEDEFPATPQGGTMRDVHHLSQDAIDLINREKLFVYGFLNYDPDNVVPGFFDLFGDRFVPGLTVEANHHYYPHVSAVMAADPEPSRDKAYKAGCAYVKDIVGSLYPYGLSGSGLEWYQAAGITKQKRWDHEIANGNFQVQSAFLRGVGQQHDIPFITYIAPMGNSPEGRWGTGADPESPFGAHLRAGKPSHLLEREWFYAWFAGSAAIVLEASHMYLFTTGEDGKSIAPGCLADAARKLNHLAYESDFDRGTPYRPACILMDERHGWSLPGAPDAHSWDPPGLLRRKIWGFFDYTHQDIMVDNFFGALYPGYERGSEWGHRYGDLVQSPYGESFDVMFSNAGQKALSKYPVTFVIGKPKLTKACKKRLEQYVSDGGNLVLNISQVDNDWQEFLGVRFSPKHNRWYKGLGTLRASDRSEWLETRIQWAENRYHYSRICAGTAEILAVTEQGDPLVVCRRLGEGKVYLVTAHFMQEISGLHRPSGLLEVSRFLVGHVLDPYQKVVVRGPKISYMVNERPDGLAIMLQNNSDHTWRGWLSFPGMGGAAATEWYAGVRLQAYKAADDLSISLEIPSYSLRVITVSGICRP